MIVVADTSPLNYLVQLGEVDLLPALFASVLIPRTVLDELRHPSAPIKVQQWSNNLPAWIEVHPDAAVMQPVLWQLDPGEREAIQLALQMRIDTVLMDERIGRNAAIHLHLKVRGTLGILEMGARLGRINFRDALARLGQTTFRLSANVRETFLRRNS